MQNFKKKAFTLVELLIVIAVIGILFVVLISKVDFATDKSKATGVQTDFRSYQLAFETVARENNGFNTLGWDEGDKADPDLYDKLPYGQTSGTYTYTNQAKDAGDRVRNSYDEGDADLDGVMDANETWNGHRIFTETWTGVYSLENPGNATDMSAIKLLENAINKNLDPKLHIVIAERNVDNVGADAATRAANNDGTDFGKNYVITMKNEAQDPWKTEYVGKYLTNASLESTTNSVEKYQADTKPTAIGIDSDPADTNEGNGASLDRGAIIIYSKGPNTFMGSHEEIVNGEVEVYVSTKGDERVDDNTKGADDYSLSTIYTYKNGYWEAVSATTGFSNNQ